MICNYNIAYLNGTPTHVNVSVFYQHSVPQGLFHNTFTNSKHYKAQNLDAFALPFPIKNLLESKNSVFFAVY